MSGKNGSGKMQSVEAGQRHREREAARSRKQSRSAREIAPLPLMKNPQRRMKAKKDLKYFCEQYFPKKFKLAWSKNHLEYISNLEKIIKEGGKQAIGMPRGEGKSTIMIGAGDWALYNAWRRYIVLVGANKDEAKKLLDSIKNTLTNNKLLLEDYPEISYPIAKLNGSALLARGQLYIGDLTNIDWKGMSVTLPTIKGSEASGSKVITSGIFGAIRGKNTDTADGETIRPDLVLIDDPQTDQMAKSPTQIQKVEDVINKAIGGLAGPGKEITCVMTCTVIEENDVADRYLNREIYPQWNGLRYKMVEEMPKNMQLWEEYRDVRKNKGKDKATEFYKQHLETMQEGAVVSWEANHTPNEVDALQHAMNKWADDESAFMSEYQNQPLRPDLEAVVVPAKEIKKRLNGLKRRQVPMDIQATTAFIDVHNDLLYWMVAAWSNDFTGYVIDYDVFPEQPRRNFSRNDRSLITLKKQTRQKRAESAIASGLEMLVKQLLSERYDMFGDEDGNEVTQIDKILIDSGYKYRIVDSVILKAGSPIVRPSLGVGVPAKKTPMEQWRSMDGGNVQSGHYWIVEKIKNHLFRTTKADVNYWKTTVHDALSISAGARGGITFWGSNPETHRMVADHLTAETVTLVEANSRKVNEWQAKPGADNHWFDCLVGNMFAASTLGIATQEERDIQELNVRPATRITNL